jgi:hypothetical protein
VSIKKTKASIVEELNEIMENLDLEESSGYSDMGSDENIKKSSKYSEEDFMAYYGNVSGNFEDTWRSGWNSTMTSKPSSPRVPVEISIASTKCM